ncbi:MAG: hypothetical protein IGS49_21010 [Chlorogloeopsis fritschii C42_A2020_084]|nr:hypothetical protein [Chlorogloeopsis fritschii C42_A2020_084]
MSTWGLLALAVGAMVQRLKRNSTLDKSKRGKYKVLND